MNRPANALIVDDEAHVRTFLRLILKEIGIETTWEASDGAQALSLVTAHRPELVLLDLNLPILGGVQVLPEIERLRPGTPVVVVTSQNAMQSVEQVARLGAVGYVLKQNPKHEILATLREILDNLAAEDASDAEG